MSRGKSAALKNSARRKKIVDTRYDNSESVSKLIRALMKDGKASIARREVYKAMNIMAEKAKNVDLPEHNDVREKEVLLLEKVIESVTPRVEVKSRRVGGANYQVPIMVNRERGRTLALRWLVDSARNRKEGQPISAKLSREMLDTLEGKSSALSKKETQDKMASANRANANLARREQSTKDRDEGSRGKV
ncbi:30S ribosomal protein S7 [Candidatus Synchoanobacter obligatus]|uniref:Small ribosomal subunit protein uS7 n=1 Tax=Candidatus Synchoanobacter obligatus TaxID=2919597 RepID=A0ABT1L5N1_9GAMM|nr:30S ribosomal protein S7 [Candidatus Synchoanobacter obligatus]MCP8352482.1 30S ribosomal protein S7 [Candidatus Synchoanobacter obligatus]